MDKIKVLLVEDDAEWRGILSSTLRDEADLFLVAAVSNRQDALNTCLLTNPDVVLMDIVLTENNLDGIEAVIDIMAVRHPKIIMLTSMDEEEIILEAFAAGAINYITKTHISAIPNAIREAYCDQVSIHFDASRAVSKEILRIRQEQFRNMLTPAEQEVLQLLSKGHTQSHIQTLLHITESTIKKHVHKILKKFGVISGKDAVEKARKRGFFNHMR
jgi:two-component system response regulator DevR